jgi:predicted HAD superfamily Cof-like phosphohydrolase
MSYLEQVEEFHRTFGQPVKVVPTKIDVQRSTFRHSLIKEELEELMDAINASDFVAMVDALADLQYVLSGTVLEMGLGTVFEQAFTEVHRSNMSKACKTLEEAEKTVHKYSVDGVATYHKQVGDYYVIYRTSDDKVLKSINYKPVDLTRFRQ